MNELDQFVKHELKVKNYLRYTDDFVIISTDKQYLKELLTTMQTFLRVRLNLTLHPQKVEFRTFHQGVDFLGYVVRPHHIVLRTNTKRRIFRKLEGRVAEYKDRILSEAQLFASLNSYLGVLSHAKAHKLKEKLLDKFWNTLALRPRTPSGRSAGADF